jgi:ribonuclease III
MKPSPLEQKINYQFRNQRLLQEALSHRSFVNEHPCPGAKDNERLEFLGDAVVNLVAAHLLMNRFPEQQEGSLSRMRAALVSEASLASLAQAIDLGIHLKLGKGEAQTAGQHKPSILADAFEALVAAMYLDGGFERAFAFLNNCLTPLLQYIQTPSANKDYKSRLQEKLQFEGSAVPEYTVIAEEGPDHNKTFEVRLIADGIETTGTGKSKKQAQQDAARNAWHRLTATD